jgi:hypothetical protein
VSFPVTPSTVGVPSAAGSPASPAAGRTGQSAQQGVLPPAPTRPPPMAVSRVEEPLRVMAPLPEFAEELNEMLRLKNVYYDDLIKGNILEPLKITPIRRNGFVDYMKSVGKLGGQNKVARLSNDRQIANALESFKVN